MLKKIAAAAVSILLLAQLFLLMLPGRLPADEAAEKSASGTMPSSASFEQCFSGELDGLEVLVQAPAGALPKGSRMVLSRSGLDLTEVLPEAGSVLQALDIAFYTAEGTETEPLKDVTVSFSSRMLSNSAEPQVWHVSDEGLADEMSVRADTDGSLSFRTDSFSLFVILGKLLRRTLTASDGRTYEISVDYGPEAMIPEGSSLEVTELAGEAYEDYLSRAAASLGAAGFEYARIFDIGILDEFGESVEPAAAVQVSVALADAAEAAFSVVHFEGKEEQPEAIEIDSKGGTVSFSTESFSAYAIVQGPAPIPFGWEKAISVEQILELGADGLYIGNPDGYFLTDGITQISSSRTGITKTKPATAYPTGRAVPYYIVPVEPGSSQVRVYCMSGNEKKYVIQTTNSLNFTDEAHASVFTLEAFGNQAETFRLKGSDNYYWNMQGGANGASFAAYQGATDTNARLCFWFFTDLDRDPYGLDGKSYGLMSWSGGVSGKAMMAEMNGENALAAKALTVMSTLNNSSQLFVPNDSDISLWTFHWKAQDKYYITGVVDGSTRYLKLGPEGISFVESEADASEIQVVPGSGSYAGEICLKAGNTALTYSGQIDAGFSTGGAVGSEWLYLVDLSELTTDYFRTYSASKVSVSAPSVTNGSRIIVYTRSWNDEKKKYDFYAIDSDGSVVQVYENGDSIEWVGGQINNLLWNFVEYYWEGTSDPNYYYELYNQYSEKFVAPQVTGSQILSDDVIGINLNGRRDGQYYSTILAWDEDNYSYVGLKVENGRIVPCPKSEAMDFFFAIMQDLNVDDELTTVPTVDHTAYGITMKIADFGTRAEMSNFLGNDDGGMGNELHQGLLSSSLGPDGYPTAAGGSLGTLLSGAQEVNHIFIESTYQQSGYYVYDSTQNFASLQGKTGGDFVVYKELGSYDSGGNKPTLKHGQFFPFNDLKPGVFASANGKNLYGLDTSHQLPDSDPRKYENLYSIEYDNIKANCFFAVELEASFTQTPSGLDAWGHDIIFEFTGDDDFWLYVDGELVIDLGGIHSAVPGSVNFSTGAVNVNGQPTTLRTLFYNNYKGRGHTDAEAEAYVNGLFEQNENGQWVFKDYTNHTMRIFYMERGASASNLQMRFNLAAVRKGTIQLSKELDGVDSTESIMAEFPYQIEYKVKVPQVNDQGDPLMDDNGDFIYTEETRLVKNSQGEGADQTMDYVFYKDTIQPVKYQRNFTVGDIQYQDVFFLKPGETADVSFWLREGELLDSYRIIECGVNTDVFSEVSVNDAAITGVAGSDYPANRKDFPIGYATTDERAKVTYVNKVDPNALRTLTITKKLFEEDGVTPIHYPDDTTTFQYRLYLASEFDEPDAANMHTYHVKNAAGEYCRWNKTEKKFESLGKTVYAELTDAEKTDASFTTSIYGTIERIPADFTVEIRNVLAGTKFQVVERPWEVPDGYSFQQYIYNGSTCLDGAGGIADTVTAGVDPAIDVCNLKGWGMRMNKLWSDADYMSGREAAHFAVFLKETDGSLTLVPGSLRALSYAEKPQSLYWYFDKLPVPGTGIGDYVIREVTVSDPSAQDGGTVTPIPEGGGLELSGTQKGENVSSLFRYTVNYEQGAVVSGSNVRVDTVTNYRPGIILKKQTWDGYPLAGAEFDLSCGDTLIGTFISDTEGYISEAFLRENVSYTLKETKAPQGWYGLQTELQLTISDGVVSVSGADSAYYTLEQAGDTGPASLTVKDRPMTFRALKQDGDTLEAMEGVRFALHRQVTVDGVTTYDLNPMPGYEVLVTDAAGVIPLLNNTLPAGTYELRERSTIEGYQMLPAYIHFTVSPVGAVTLLDPPAGVSLSEVFDEEDGSVAYELTVGNYRRKNVRILKVAEENGAALADAAFALYRAADCDAAGRPLPGAEALALPDGNVSSAQGLLSLGSLAPGDYVLWETASPDGYFMPDKPIRISVTANGVTASFGGSALEVSTSGTGLSTVWQIRVKNAAGIELPQTGGSGRERLLLIGGALMLLAGSALILKAKRKETRR